MDGFTVYDWNTNHDNYKLIRVIVGNTSKGPKATGRAAPESGIFALMMYPFGFLML